MKILVLSKHTQAVLPHPAPPMNVATGHPYSSGYNARTVVRGTVPWSPRLCHCCDDPANCLVTTFCPCITFGQIAELFKLTVIGYIYAACALSGTIYGLLMAFSGCPCLYSCCYRSRITGHYDLEETPSADCLVHFCCEPCALCQEYRELKNRGFDMAIGDLSF
ncbi:hypothetical protein Cgig2_008026 [Carnegiea gigantea]|uniref:Cell number regulator 1 n=1 Tax=Carnegiea gigantea TaxID=171969 RepID=A0A9Q1L0A8_9CARY|nr:hypothetical protein Cgig2_008026 [Carnegiea gigantea]